MWEAERVGHPSDWGGVPSTVHILVYLLRHLLRMTEVRCGDGHSVDGGEGPGETTNTHYTVQSHVWIKIRINDRGSTQLTASWPQCCGPWWFAECSSHWKREQVPVNAYCGSTKNVFKDEEIPSQLGLTWCPYHIIHDNNMLITLKHVGVFTLQLHTALTNMSENKSNVDASSAVKGLVPK